MNIKKITSLEFTGNGLLLKNTKQEMLSIPFSAIEKTYIQKRKLTAVTKMVIVAVMSLIFIANLRQMPFEMVLISLPLYIPLFVFIQKYKWYRMCIIDKTNIIFYQVFFNENKYDYVSKVVVIRKGIFDNRHNTKTQYSEVFNSAVSENANEYTQHSLSIA